MSCPSAIPCYLLSAPALLCRDDQTSKTSAYTLAVTPGVIVRPSVARESGLPCHSLTVELGESNW